MKLILKSAAVLALMFSVAVGMAKEPKLIVNKSDMSLVFKLNGQSQSAEINFVDMDNHVIYTEYVSDQEPYMKKFDLQNLEPGTYGLTMEDALKTISYTIIIKEGDIKVSKRKESNKPVFRKSDDMVYLNLLNLDKEEILIKVYDSSNRLVFSETLENEMIVEKAFNFENAFEDSYTVVVTDDDNTYYENIVID